MFGVVGFLSLSVREYPDVDPPVVSVQTTYTGAAASVVESRITQVLEERPTDPPDVDAVEVGEAEAHRGDSERVSPGPLVRASRLLTIIRISAGMAAMYICLCNAVTDGDIRDQVLANAPEAQHGFFAVPKVIE